MQGFLNLPGEAGAGRPSTLPAERPGANLPGNRLPGQNVPGNRLPGETLRPADRPLFNSDLANNAQDRVGQRQDWGNNVRDNWHGQAGDWLHDFQGDFGDPGWRLDYPNMAHGYWHSNHPYANGWWTVATTAAITGWCTSGWGQPAYYDYGSGGNVTYEGDTVYVNEQPVPADQYAMQAQQTAGAGAEQLTQPLPEGQEMEWMPLGVFALSTSAEETTPTRSMQLAISKEGVINGTLINADTKKTLPLQGAVDRKTQRACWYAGDKTDVVAETGIYNLTQDQTSILVHFGKDRTEEYLLVRLDPPKDVATGTSQ